MFLFASCTRNQLIRQNEIFKAEVEMLRERVPQQKIILKPAERERLIELGKDLGAKLKDLITVVMYGTFLKWLRDRQPEEQRSTRPGRPRTLEEIRHLIIRIRQETGWP